MLPPIQSFITFAFRHVPAEQREEFVHESIANTAVAFASLVAQGRGEQIFPSALAYFAVRQTRAGRRVDDRLNSRDVLSLVCQRRHGFALKSLDRSGAAATRFQEHSRLIEPHPIQSDDARQSLSNCFKKSRARKTITVCGRFDHRLGQ
jgi:hypothetical protein